MAQKPFINTLNNTSGRHKKLYPIGIYFILSLFLLLGDYQAVLYDSEPDYFFNALSITENGLPIGAHHPGTITYYIVALLLSFSDSLQINLHTSIYFIRFIFLIIALGILFIGNQIKVSLLVFVFSFIYFCPELNSTMKVIGPELLLLPLSFLILNKLDSRSPYNITMLFIIYGVMLNIKASSLILAPLIVKAVLSNRKAINRKRLFFQFLTIPPTIYFVLSMPVLSQSLVPLTRIIKELLPINVIESLFNVDLKIDLFSLILIFVLTLITCLTIYICKSFFKRASIRFFENDIYTVILTAGFLVFFVQSLLDDAPALRHFLVALPFIANFLLLKVSFFTRNFIPTGLIFLSLIFFSLQPSTSFFGGKSLLDIEINKQKGKVYLYQESVFNSEIRFLKWGQYRYSSSRVQIPNRWQKDHSILEENNVEYLDLRSIEYWYERGFKKEPMKEIRDYRRQYNKCFFKQAIDLTFNNNSYVVLEEYESLSFKRKLTRVSKELDINFRLNLYNQIRSIQFYKLEADIKSLSKYLYLCDPES